MDGTLIDSKKDITISINYIREKHYSLPPLSEEFVVNAINMEVRNLPKLFYETENYERKDRLAFEEHYRIQCVQHPYLYEGILETLEILKKAEFKLSVATNAPTQFAQRMLESLHVAHMFDEIVGADRVKESKPSPEMLYKILNSYEFNRAVDVAWMIGDNSKDMLSAKNAGIHSLFATWGFSPYSEHDILLNHPQEIVDIVL